ncbi:hypothetical protein [Sulfolobus spindle-shaped virus]|nr:hypothetical protein [Sulfolobus spindle-shaped virus]AZG03622.1 hypothetical protein [Sulfolobus spindle-shaped virus]AZG03669.1 hypothetical protein [Sulfolobus spindle-shaped virus]AZG03761.1 hypothetical protein [Sulfolobus spindle-shaped virus]AZG03806.1 hypothetical protein [Sulfolobus spindle-shaped virus]
MFKHQKTFILLLFKYKLAMKEREYVGIKLDREIKEKFVFLAKQEKLTLTDAIEILIIEALSRGYIDKKRQEVLKEGVNA